MEIRNEIIEMLKQCVDPEIPVDLWNLGLIYNIDIKEKKDKKSDIFITMSLTTPGCGMGQHMADDIKQKVSKIKSVNEVQVDVTFDPPWEPKMMTEDAKEKLGFAPTPVANAEPQIKTEWE